MITYIVTWESPLLGKVEIRVYASTDDHDFDLNKAIVSTFTSKPTKIEIEQEVFERIYAKS